MLVITTSCVVSSRPYPETPPPLMAAPVPMPSVCAMPSLPRPPRPPKTIMPVFSCTLLLPPPETTNDGISVAMAAYPCAVGSASMSSVFICCLPPRALDVDDRALAGDRHRLLERADAHLGVDRRDEIGRQHQAVANEGVEPGQLEADFVGAGSQVEDPGTGPTVGDSRADLLDQRVARRLHGHARQNRARRVGDDSRDGRLGRRDGGNEQQSGPGRRVPCSAGSAWQSLSADVAPRRYRPGRGGRHQRERKSGRALDGTEAKVSRSLDRPHSKCNARGRISTPRP